MLARLYEVMHVVGQLVVRDKVGVGHVVEAVGAGEARGDVQAAKRVDGWIHRERHVEAHLHLRTRGHAGG